MDLPPELVDRAAQELNETPETRAAGLKALLDYYEAHPAERPHRTDAPYLIMFLRHAKFDPVKARGRLAAMERWLHDCRDEIGDVNALRGEQFRAMYEEGWIGILPKDRRTRDGAVISLMLPRLMQPMADPSLMLRWNLWVLGRAVHDPYLQVCGQVILESFKDYSMLHSLRFQQLPHAIMKKNFKFAQECMPFRMRGIWLVWQPKWVGFLFALAKPFLSAKLRGRVRMFGGALDALHALIDPSVLPLEFGGTCTDTGMDWFEAQVKAEAEELRAQDEAAAAASTE
ncbi:hypothetical protein HYH02_009615 [Chlamydomonas schloesseri]|uniref:CRAL-TRIO domain-containing protein n=1 Tax=Chlamydomonas schloesseri TaxID=2026947 RepID=A0A835TDL5_9CHLO|nr:hypothetical protein HYH02_009615 [Chlamydomonas schloesseri]|eukprot:KAG2442126.1 hypothetical protein HYH02_009615 [Chlamydomonas schloesseri]